MSRRAADRASNLAGVRVPRRWALGFAGAVIVAAADMAIAQSQEPPVDLPEGAEYAVASGDSLVPGEFEVALGVGGDGAGTPRQRRRVRLSDPDLRGEVREGADPLAGGAVETRAGRSVFKAGTLSPRWSRGLLFGAPSDPWQHAALVRDTPARGRSGEGLMAWWPGGAELLAGRFARRGLFGGRMGLGPLRLGAVAGAAPAQASAALAGAEVDLELVISRRRWRTEGAARRPLGRWSVAAVARMGSRGFQSLAEPARAGPARALAGAIEGPWRGARVRAFASTWVFGAGRSGARLAVEASGTPARETRLAAGFEEQHGIRRPSQRDPGFRQGLWMEWSRSAHPVALTLRQEAWGAESGVRHAVRRVASARVELAGPHRVRFALDHAAFFVRRGESLYLREIESDRLLLRAFSGSGQSTRFEIRLPAARHAFHASARLETRDGRARPPRWSLEWSRRGRARPPNEAPAIAP